jgi:hypothetical protein
MGGISSGEYIQKGGYVTTMQAGNEVFRQWRRQITNVASGHDEVAFSEHRFFMSVRMALNRNRHGQARDVTGIGIEMDRQRCRIATVALRTDS